MENILFRIEKLEKEIEQIRKSLRKKVEKQKLTLKEKFDIHDRAQNLKREFIAMRIEDINLTEAQKDELKIIIRCFAELIDHALGKEFP